MVYSRVSPQRNQLSQLQRSGANMSPRRTFRDILSDKKYQEVSGGEGGLFSCNGRVAPALFLIFLLYPLSPISLVVFSLSKRVVQFLFAGMHRHLSVVSFVAESSGVARFCPSHVSGDA